MKVIHVVGTISLASSGPSQSVPALCRGLAREGVDVELHYLDYGGRPEVAGVATHAYPRVRIPGLEFADWNPKLLAALWRRAEAGTIFHAHGLWHFPTIYPAWVGGIRGVPWVMSPRGTLGEWALRISPRKKAASLLLGQRYALRRAAFLHATSEAEKEEFRRFGLDGRIAVIPNAVEVPESVTARPVGGPRRDVLFLSRLHPKKAVEGLLRGWRRVAREFADDRLVIAGPAELDYDQTLERIVAAESIPRVEFVGELRGDAKWRALASAKVFVLPSHNENFGMVVAEALAAGTPVIASRGTPWQELETERAGWWVDNDEASLGRALRSALLLPDAERLAMGQRGRDLVKSRFSLPAVAGRMKDEYERVHAERSPSRS